MSGSMKMSNTELRLHCSYCMVEDAETVLDYCFSLRCRSLRLLPQTAVHFAPHYFCVPIALLAPACEKSSVQHDALVFLPDTTGQKLRIFGHCTNANHPILKLFQKPYVVVEEKANVVDCVLQHGKPFNAHPERKPGVNLRVNPNPSQHIRVHHAGTEDFEPTCS